MNSRTVTEIDSVPEVPSEVAPSRVDVDASSWLRFGEALRVVECELSTHCNRSCSYCPQALDLVPDAQPKMTEGVLDALLSDLARIDFSGRFSHHLYGEPLLDPGLGDNVRRIRRALPRAVQVLFTNGDLLDDEGHRELIDAGVALFVVTRHSVGPYPERARQVVQAAKQLALTSRGGSIRFLSRRRSLASFQRLPCFAPTEMAIVTSEGRVLRCYEDARREAPLGDLRTHTLAAIWTAAAASRQRLEAGERVALGGPCASCDNANHQTPGSSVGTEFFWATHLEAGDVAAKANRP